jgi:hypothetical protein
VSPIAIDKNTPSRTFIEQQLTTASQAGPLPEKGDFSLAMSDHLWYAIIVL